MALNIEDLLSDVEKHLIRPHLEGHPPGCPGCRDQGFLRHIDQTRMGYVYPILGDSNFFGEISEINAKVQLGPRDELLLLAQRKLDAYRSDVLSGKLFSSIRHISLIPWRDILAAFGNDFGFHDDFVSPQRSVLRQARLAGLTSLTSF